MADNHDPRYQIVIGLFLLGLSVFFIPFCTTILPLIIVSLVSGLRMSLSTIATTKYMADMSAKEEMSASMGALSSIMDIGHATGPFIAGIVITAAGINSGFFFCIIPMVIIMIYFWVCNRSSNDILFNLFKS